VSIDRLGLPTVHRIDRITVAVYGGRHRPVGALCRFWPYTATGVIIAVSYRILRPFTAVNTVIFIAKVSHDA